MLINTLFSLNFMLVNKESISNSCLIHQHGSFGSFYCLSKKTHSKECITLLLGLPFLLQLCQAVFMEIAS